MENWALKCEKTKDHGDEEERGWGGIRVLTLALQIHTLDNVTLLYLKLSC